MKTKAAIWTPTSPRGAGGMIWDLNARPSFDSFSAGMLSWYDGMPIFS